jgi:hypothetical protein
MSMTSRQLRDCRRHLRFAQDDIEDALDLIGSDDKKLLVRLRGLARQVREELEDLDRKIAKAEGNGGDA